MFKRNSRVVAKRYPKITPFHRTTKILPLFIIILNYVDYLRGKIFYITFGV